MGSRILSVRMHSRPGLAPDTVLAVWSSMARDGMSAGNDMDREPGTRDGKPGTRDGASGTTGYGKASTRDETNFRDRKPCLKTTPLSDYLDTVHIPNIRFYADQKLTFYSKFMCLIE